MSEESILSENNQSESEVKLLFYVLCMDCVLVYKMKYKHRPFPLFQAVFFLKRLKDYIQFSIFLAGGEGFYYSSQRENSQETKYINFHVTKSIIIQARFCSFIQ